MKVVMGLLALLLLTGCIITQEQIDEMKKPCPECPASNCSKEEALLKDQRLFFEKEFDKQANEYADLEEVSEELWNDYFDCYVATVCWGNIAGCEEWLGEFTKEDLDYFIASCGLAKNYDKYHTRFEGE